MIRPIEIPEIEIPVHFKKHVFLGDDGGGTKLEYLKPANGQFEMRCVYLLGIDDESFETIRNTRRMILQIFSEHPIGFSIDPYTMSE